MAGRIYVATESAAGLVVDGEPVVLHKGVTRVREGHKLLKQHPEFFEPYAPEVHFEVEDARSAPAASKRATKKSEQKD